jgi:hypothetical protein
MIEHNSFLSAHDDEAALDASGRSEVVGRKNGSAELVILLKIKF